MIPRAPHLRIRGTHIATKTPDWKGRMRKAAGVILIVLGLLTVRLPGSLFLMGVQGGIVQTMMLLLTAFIVGGGLCALLRRHRWWASAGVVGVVAVETTIVLLAFADNPLTGEGALMVGSLLFVAPAVVAGVFLYKTKTEFRAK